jgi:hypothetical protein
MSWGELKTNYVILKGLLNIHEKNFARGVVILCSMYRIVLGKITILVFYTINYIKKSDSWQATGYILTEKFRLRR